MPASAQLLVSDFLKSECFQPEEDQEDPGGREEPERQEVHEHVQQGGDTGGC